MLLRRLLVNSSVLSLLTAGNLFASGKDPGFYTPAHGIIKQRPNTIPLMEQKRIIDEREKQNAKKNTNLTLFLNKQNAYKHPQEHQKNYWPWVDLVYTPQQFDQEMEKLPNESCINVSIENLHHTQDMMTVLSLHGHKLHGFSFVNNELDIEKVNFLFTALEKMPNVQSLWLNGNNIGPQGIKILASAFDKMEDLKRLGLSRNHLTQDEIFDLIQSISTKK